MPSRIKILKTGEWEKFYVGLANVFATSLKSFGFPDMVEELGDLNMPKTHHLDLYH